MMTLRHFPRALLMTAGLLAVAGCAGNAKPLDTGQRMSARGENIAARGTAWADGQKDMMKGEAMVRKSAERVADGEKKLQRAQDDIAKAQAQIRTARADQMTGEQLISSGTRQMQQAEADYNQIRREPSAITVQ